MLTTTTGFRRTSDPYNIGLVVSHLPNSPRDTTVVPSPALNLNENNTVPWFFRNGKYCWKSGDQYYNVPTGTANIAAGDCTIRIIIEPLSYLSPLNVLYTKGTSSITREIYAAINAGGTLNSASFGRTNSALGIALDLKLEAVNDIVLRRSGTTVTVFVNGVSKGTFTNAGVTATSGIIYIGRTTEANSSPIDGYIYGFEVWQRALSDGEIVGLYQSFHGPVSDDNRFLSYITYPLDIIFDNFVFGQSISTAHVFNRSAEDTIEFTDSVYKTQELYISLKDFIKLGDTYSNTKVINISLTDTLTLSEGAGNKFTDSKTDTIGFSDSVMSLNMLSSTITFADSVVFEASQTLEDSIIFTGVVTFTISRVISMSDTISFTGAGIGFWRTINEEWYPFEFGGEIG